MKRHTPAPRCGGMLAGIAFALAFCILSLCPPAVLEAWPAGGAMPRTIDGLLASTFLGGAAQDGYARISLVREPGGDILVAGGTASSDFPPVPGGYDPTHNGNWDIAIVRLDSSLTTLKAATFLGGGFDDGRYRGVCLALGADGTVYVAGSTDSTGFPTTAAACDASHNGRRDAVIARFTSGLDTLLAATYLGGSLDDDVSGLLVSPQGDVYVSGQTLSTNLPTTSGAYDRTPGGNENGFIVRLDANLTTLVAATYLGGDGLEYVQGLCLDGAGDVYLTGISTSTNFPTTFGAFDRMRTAVDLSGYVSKLSGTLATLLASTYFDGSVSDFPYGIALGTTGDVIITGHTASPNMPTTAGVYDRSFNGGTGENDDVYISRFSPDLRTLVASTFLGGAAFEYAMTVRCDGQGHVIVVGRTGSTDFPVRTGAYSTTLHGTDDIFISRLDEGLTGLEASTFLGGNDYDSGGFGLAVDPAGSVYISGRTYSTDFPTTEGAYDQTCNGEGDWVLCRLDSMLWGSIPLDVPPPGSDARRLSLRAGPNPFRAATRIRFALERAAAVRVTVHDAAGRQVAVLADDVLGAGPHALEWGGRDAGGRRLAPGTYMVRIASEGRSAGVRVVLVR